MEHDPKVAAEHVLAGRCNVPAEVLRGSGCQEDPSLAPRRIVEAFTSRFNSACDTGIWKRLTNVVLEPRNPFDPGERRAPKRDVVVLLTLATVAVFIALLFNLNAPE